MLERPIRVPTLISAVRSALRGDPAKVGRQAGRQFDDPALRRDQGMRSAVRRTTLPIPRKGAVTLQDVLR